jgi:hypothetical protein
MTIYFEHTAEEEYTYEWRLSYWALEKDIPEEELLEMKVRGVPMSQDFLNKWKKIREEYYRLTSELSRELFAAKELWDASAEKQAAEKELADYRRNQDEQRLTRLQTILSCSHTWAVISLPKDEEDYASSYTHECSICNHKISLTNYSDFNGNFSPYFIPPGSTEEKEMAKIFAENTDPWSSMAKEVVYLTKRLGVTNE